MTSSLIGVGLEHVKLAHEHTSAAIEVSPDDCKYVLIGLAVGAGAVGINDVGINDVGINDDGPWESMMMDRAAGTPMEYESWTRQRLHRPAENKDLAMQRQDTCLHPSLGVMCGAAKTRM